MHGWPLVGCGVAAGAASMLVRRHQASLDSTSRMQLCEGRVGAHRVQIRCSTQQSTYSCGHPAPVSGQSVLQQL